MIINLNQIIQTRLYRVSSKAHLTVPQELHDIILGSMLGDKNCFEYTLKRKAFNIKQNYISFQPINFAIKGPYSVVGAMIFNRGFKSIGFNLLNNTQYNTEKIYYNADKEKKDIIKDNRKKSGVYC
jgi:hypothetical protein